MRFFGATITVVPDEMELQLLTPSVRRVVEEATKYVEQSRKDIEALFVNLPDTPGEAKEALAQLKRSRAHEQSEVKRLGEILAIVMEMGFDTAGWNTAAPELSLPSGRGPALSSEGTVSTIQATH